MSLDGLGDVASDAFLLTLDCTRDCMIFSWRPVTKLRARRCRSAKSRTAVP
jgi:hypothetical protein